MRCRIVWTAIALTALVWAVAAALLATVAGAVTDQDLETMFKQDAAWVFRLHRAVAWNSGQETMTADQVMADLKARLDHLIRFEEERHGIDPETQADTPAKLLSQIAAERDRAEAERSGKEAAQRALTAAVAEVDSLKDLLAKEAP